LEDDVWVNPVDVLHRRLVSRPRKGVLEDALTRACLRRGVDIAFAESVRDGTADAVVVALDMSTPQGRRRKKAVSVGISDEVITSTHARLNGLANVSPLCRKRNTERQRHCYPPLCLRKASAGDGQAAEEKLRKRVFRVREEGHPPEVSDGEGGGPLREDPKSELIALLRDPFVQLADIRPKHVHGPSKMISGNISSAARSIRLRGFKFSALAGSYSSRNFPAS
jgi:hypothetical protein